jgi:hypothetical protein
MTPLCELARKYGTDKGGEHIPYGDVNHCCHVYTPVYWELFKDRRETVSRVLEIGVSEGKSIRMWQEFFPNALIYGIDNNDRWEGERIDRVQLFHVDQSSADSLYDWLRPLASGPFLDIIIDDGSHIFQHQVTSMRTLLPFLKPDGIYVVEDETAVITDEVPTGLNYNVEVYRWPDPRDMMQVIRRAN